VLLKGAAVRSSEKTRLLVLSLFFIILIAFAIFYNPVNAFSRATDQRSAGVTSAGTGAR
jgi:predicted membrane protein